MHTEITIVLEAFDSVKINQSFLKLMTYMSNNKINNIRHISLPITKKIYTVLRSPHIDKRSREQFEIRKYSKLIKFTQHINIFDNENEYLNAFKQQILPEVAFKIKFSTYEYL